MLVLIFVLSDNRVAVSFGRIVSYSMFVLYFLCLFLFKHAQAWSGS